MIVLCLSLVFATMNLMMAPFAFLKTCVHKVNLVRRKSISKRECFFYFFIGMPIFLVA